MQTQTHPRLELRGVTKRFASLVANNNLHLTVQAGGVHALLGENGAGKSTLMNILYGLLKPDSGTILIDGQEVNIASPSDAIRHGIGMVHQHFMLVPTITVLENVLLMLANEEKGFLPKTRQVKARILELSEKYGLDVDPSALVSNLTVGQQQRVEIIKAVYNDSELLILDEPTAVLTPTETVELFQIIKRFTESGKSVIFISHKLGEVMELSSRITVLRAGKVIDTVMTADTSPQELSFLMVGKKLDMRLHRSDEPAGAVVLAVEDFVVKSLSGTMAVDHLHLQVRAGEVYGIAGVDGNGQSELIKGICSLARRESGSVTINGTQLELLCPPSAALHCGMAHIPEDRQRIGTIMSMSVAENLVLHNINEAQFRSHKLLDWKKINAYSESIVKKYDVRASGTTAPIHSLSGGNQQKLIVARELEKSPQLLLAMHPTRGVDIGAIDFIHKQIIAARNAGCAVLLVSTELDEILALSDRIGVIFKGKIKGETDRNNVDMNKISLWMAGHDSAECQTG